MSSEQYFPGLEGVIAGETAISTITGGLSYRGYSITDLAGQSTFPEVAYLLLHGELPNEEQLADFKAILDESAEIAPPIIDLVRDIPLHVGSMDVLRTGISGWPISIRSLTRTPRQPTLAKRSASWPRFRSSLPRGTGFAKA